MTGAVSTKTLTWQSNVSAIQRAKRLEALLDHIVVVAAPGIDRDVAALRVVEQGQGIAAGPVVQAQHDHAARLGPQRPGLGPPVGLVG